jgi:hypothetical protein
VCEDLSGRPEQHGVCDMTRACTSFLQLCLSSTVRLMQLLLVCIAGRELHCMAVSWLNMSTCALWFLMYS